MKNSYSILFFPLAFCFFSFSSKAQLTANFTPSKVQGCSPLSVFFINTSTGVSNSAVYNWDFGNGNSFSTTNKNASVGATYIAEQTFIAKLTVIDNGVQSVKTINITVFKKPVPNFTLDSDSGCTPKTVHFTSTSTCADGTISNYFWDFGNGNTQTGDTSLRSVVNIYKNQGKFSVSLNVKSSNGCISSLLIKTDTMNILLSPKAALGFDKNYLCKAGSIVHFSNNSTDELKSTYLWKYGDGASGTSSNSTYNYPIPGIYTPSLIVTNSNGCADSTTANSSINVASFTSNFSSAAVYCSNTNLNFNNTSVPLPDSSKWFFSDSLKYYRGINTNHVFAFPSTYTVKLINSFGICLDTISKNISINPNPSVNGFIVKNLFPCGAPDTIQCIDTTSGISTRVWNIDGTSIVSFSSSPYFVLTKDSTYKIILEVQYPSGCKSSTSENIVVSKPQVDINYTSNSTVIINDTTGCSGLALTFWANSQDSIKSYAWDFGDTTFSADSAPHHVYNNVGIYPVKLGYTTKKGCVDTVVLRNVHTFIRPTANFGAPVREICGNTPVVFKDSTPLPVTKWIWNFGDSTGQFVGKNQIHKFKDSGYFDITLVAINEGCSDTLKKKQYILVHAPFPVYKVLNTCDENRDSAEFINKSKYADSGYWDFGDSSGIIAYDTSLPVHNFKHRYLKDGVYLTKLTLTKNQCTVSDSAIVSILTKQSPFLQSNVTQICANDSNGLAVQIDSLHPNPAVSSKIYYSFYDWEYGDSSLFKGTINGPTNWGIHYSGVLHGLTAGKSGLRVVLQSAYFGCLDTSNYLNIKINGPIADCKIYDTSVCFKMPTQFIDASKTNFNVPIIQWIWNFGDNVIDTLSNNGNTSHNYKSPGVYPISLKVIDQDGCYDILSNRDTSKPVGPKAAFNWYPQKVIIGSTVGFYNATNTYGSPNTQYLWTFSSNGKHYTTLNAVNNYKNALIDTVLLIASNQDSTCVDTTFQIIPVKKGFAIFDYSSLYINGVSCPPLVLYLKSHSINTTEYRWDFGDGSSGSGFTKDTAVSHTYNKPGVYKIVLYTYNNGVFIDSTFDLLTVKGPYALIKSNVQKGCIPTPVTISAVQKNSTQFIWDFGDGSVVSGIDTFQTHIYNTVGFFVPNVILIDSSGCQSTFTYPKTIFIDSLNVSFKPSANKICDSGIVVFTPNIGSYATIKLGEILQYHWDFGTAKTGDTSNSSVANFYYDSLGKYYVQQKVMSNAGCLATYKDSIFVKPSSKGIIHGPIEVCEFSPVLFTGTSKVPGSVSWKWYFDNGDSSINQNPSSEIFNADSVIVRTKTITLITELNACYDTTYQTLLVHALPKINLLPKSTRICDGDPVNLIAHDGVIFDWSPIVFVNTLSTPTVFPHSKTTYNVKVTNSFGCVNKDSTTISVTLHPNLNYVKDTFICRGGSVQLFTSGAASYQWIQDITTLSNLTINPFASPYKTPTIYKFVGYDSFHCFHDTGSIKVNIKENPIVKTDSLLFVTAGNSVQLITNSSPDVVEFSWIPSDYLSCFNCPSPILTPRSDKNYLIKVSNEFGCTDTAALKVKINCGKYVFIPSAFTPNKDARNLNEIFYPLGRGVKIVKSFRIFNRLGELLFNKENIQLNDRIQGWNGTYLGKDVESGTYVYYLEAQCDTGELFSMQGTVVVIR